MACAVTEPAAGFDGYLTQCSDDTAAAASGAVLPDYPAEIATCNADLSTCNDDLDLRRPLHVHDGSGDDAG